MFGAYTLLDLQWLDADRIYGGIRNFVAPLPTTQSIELWTLLSRRYKDEPAVLFDIFTEPHDRLNDDPSPLNRDDGTTYPADQRSVTMAEWQPWAQTLTSVIRAENADSLVFIPGINWAYDLRGMPTNLSNIVYSSHVYSNKGMEWPEAFGDLSSLLGLSVGGIAVSNNPPPNTTILLPGIGSVTLNEQTCDGGGAPPCSGSTSSGIRVRAIHVIVDNPNSSGVPQGADVIVGEAHADSFHP